jgi:beta-glucosidase
VAYQFPKGFIWGTATAAHQVEGGNTASDLWLMEWMKDSIFTEPSADACDHYHRYDSDIGLLKGLGFNTYRLSIEWARIEPEEGFFSKAALDHYRRMIASCHAQNVIPMVTFHHFTAPLWFTRDGGWENPKSVDRFARYCEAAARALGDLIPFACTINEANIPIMVTMMRRAVGIRGGGRIERALAEAARLCGGEPGKFSPYLSGDGIASAPNIIAAHRKGYDVLKGLVDGKVGITIALNNFQCEPGGEELFKTADHAINGQFLEPLKGNDFVGVQTCRRPTARRSRRWVMSSIRKRWKPRSGRRRAKRAAPLSSPKTASAPKTTCAASPIQTARWKACCAASRTASTSAATSTGR